MKTVVLISGASSGIGAAMAELAPQDARTIGISRRPPAHGDHLAADLADPASWKVVAQEIEAVLDTERPREAMLLHFAGVMAPIGAASSVDLGAYQEAVLLNSASGQVLGAAVLAACTRREIQATILMCSSPAASAPRAGATQYCAGKAALEQWVRAAALEQKTAAIPAKVFAVVPYGVDTAMVREAMETPSEVLPLGDVFRSAAAAHRLADPTVTAREIWDAISGEIEPGQVVAVGAVPSIGT